MFEAGEITRTQFQQQMAVHQQELIAEMEEVRLNPIAAFIDHVLNKRAAAKLEHQYGEDPVREVFAALAEVPGFPPAKYLWNAQHPHMPLHCFIRTKREPVFRVVSLTVLGQATFVTVEHGQAGKNQAVREEFSFRRNRQGQLILEKRLRVA